MLSASTLSTSVYPCTHTHTHTGHPLIHYWRASVASETLTGVTQLKIGDVCLFIYMDVCMSFCTLTLRIFVFAPRSTPSQTSLNRILWCSDHYPYHLLFTALNGFAGVKTYWSSISIRVSGGGKLIRYLSQL